MEANEKDRRKGLIATIVVHVAMLLLFIFFGITKMIPPPEEGIAINFGYEDDGSGNTTQAAPVQPQTKPQEVPQETTEQVDKVVTQESVDAPSVSEEKPKPKTQPTEKPKEKVEEAPKPSNQLQNIINRTRTGQGEGEGETKGGGDQGDPDGDRNSPSREGGGAGGSGDYRLGGRKALDRPKPTYDCAEEGRVVVKVWVDRGGRVINAIPGEKIPGGPATTTSSSCLFNRAKDAAMRTTWQGDPTAPDNQVGFIIYNFQKT